MSFRVQLSRGLFRENPLAVLLLGLCPAAAVTTRVIDALWMALGVTAVTLLSTLGVWLVGSRAREGAATGGAGNPGGASAGALLGALLIASCLTASFESLLLAFVPAEAASLGIYAPLVSVNCLVMAQIQGARRQLFASRALSDSIGKCLGFSAGLLAIALVREGLGAGTLTLFPVGAFSGVVTIPGISDDPPRALELAGGGLLTLGYLAAAARLRRGVRTAESAGPGRGAEPAASGFQREARLP